MLIALSASQSYDPRSIKSFLSPRRKTSVRSPASPKSIIPIDGPRFHDRSFECPSSGYDEPERGRGIYGPTDREPLGRSGPPEHEEGEIRVGCTSSQSGQTIPDLQKAPCHLDATKDLRSRTLARLRLIESTGNIDRPRRRAGSIVRASVECYSAPERRRRRRRVTFMGQTSSECSLGEIGLEIASRAQSKSEDER